MITVVCWLWGNKYSERHVQVLQASVARHLPLPHRFVCITDRRSIPGVECVPMPPRPPGATAESIRLWLFSREARKKLGGDVFLNLDVDIVVCGSLLWIAGAQEPLVMWKSESVGPHRFALNPTVMLVRGKSFTFLWEAFARNAAEMLSAARRAGWTGTEQAVIAHHYEKCESLPVVFTEADGIYSMRGFNADTPLPADARIVSFHGRRDPAASLDIPWVREHWCL